MNGKLIRILGPFASKSRNGETYTKLFFESQNGREYYSYASDKNRNYKRWKAIAEQGVGTEVAGLRVYRGDIIDADSPVKITATAGVM